MTSHVENTGTTSKGEPFSRESKNAPFCAIDAGGGAENQLENVAFAAESSFRLYQQLLPNFAAALRGSGGSMEKLGDFDLSMVPQRTREPSGTRIPLSGMTAGQDKGKHAALELTTGTWHADTVVLGRGTYTHRSVVVGQAADAAAATA